MAGTPSSAPYEIGRASRVCGRTGRELHPGDRAVVALIDKDPGAPFERLDLSEEAWTSMERPEGLFAFWRLTIPERDAQGPLLDAGSMMSVFEQLAEDEDPRRQALRYLIALVLVRKKLLVQTGSRRTPGRAPGAILVQARGGGEDAETIEVAEPALDPALLAEVTAQLDALLAGDAGGENEAVNG